MRHGLADIVERQARSGGRHVALHFEGHDVTYSQLWRYVENATHRLNEVGVRPGDRVATISLNHPAVIVLLFALARLGAIFLPLNYRLAQVELAAVLDHADANLIVADQTYRTTGRALADGSCVDLLELEDFIDRVKPGDGAELVDPSLLCGNAGSPVLLVYTSGTTGKPKGALHTQAGLIANCDISAGAHAFTQDDHVLTVLPLFHVGGLCIQTLPTLSVGARVTLHSRFDPAEWLADVRRLRPTTSLMVPATLRAVIQHGDFDATDLSSLRQLGAGSSSVPDSLIAAFHARSVPVCQVYGATETGPVSIYLGRDDAITQAGSAGKPGCGVDVRLVDEQGIDVSAGRVGEIWLRAPNVMQGYWREPDHPDFRDGWFHTGDLAWCDEAGFYRVVGRSKDMIISGGENVYAAEIENILADCPSIAEVAVVGLPDATWGEVVAAVIVRKPGEELSQAAVMALFEGKLARFKHPRRVIFVEDLPKTALGKVQKKDLVARLSRSPTA